MRLPAAALCRLAAPDLPALPISTHALAARTRAVGCAGGSHGVGRQRARQRGIGRAGGCESWRAWGRGAVVCATATMLQAATTRPGTQAFKQPLAGTRRRLPQRLSGVRASAQHRPDTHKQQGRWEAALVGLAASALLLVSFWARARAVPAASRPALLAACSIWHCARWSLLPQSSASGTPPPPSTPARVACVRRLAALPACRRRPQCSALSARVCRAGSRRSRGR